VCDWGVYFSNSCFRNVRIKKRRGGEFTYFQQQNVARDSLQFISLRRRRKKKKQEEKRKKEERRPLDWHNQLAKNKRNENSAKRKRREEELLLTKSVIPFFPQDG
jgi:hypothetical protein